MNHETALTTIAPLNEEEEEELDDLEEAVGHHGGCLFSLGVGIALASCLFLLLI